MLKLGNPFGQPSTGALPYGYNVQTDPIFIEPKPQFQRVKLVPPQAVPLPAVPSIPIPAPRPAAPEYRGPVSMGSRAGLPPELQASRRISLDFNSALNVTSPGVEIIVPQDVSDQEAEAASAYAQGVASLFDEYGYGGYGIRPSPFKPGVKRKGIEASRGMSNTFHLEPFFLQDERAREIFMQPEFQADYADLINRTVRTIPNSVTIAPHVGPGKDQGAQFDFDGKTITEYGLGMQILPQLDQQREMQTLMSPGRGNFPLQERFENSGILPALGSVVGVPFAEQNRRLYAANQNLARATGDFIRNPSMETFVGSTMLAPDGFRPRFPGDVPAGTPVRTPGEAMLAPDGFKPRFLGDVPAAAPMPTPVTPPTPTATAADAGKGPGLPSGALGLFSDPEATRTIAQEAVTAAEKVGSVRGGSKPLTKPQRDRMNPMNMGLIAFGLSLLGGKDITEAMNNGLAVTDYIEGRRTKARQRDAFNEYIQSLPPAEQQIARAMEASGNIDGLLEMQLQSAKQEQAQMKKMGLASQLAQLVPGTDPALLLNLTEKQLLDELREQVFDGADGDAPELNQRQQDATFAAMTMRDALSDMYEIIEQGYDISGPAREPFQRELNLQFESAFQRFLGSYGPFSGGKNLTEAELRIIREGLKPGGRTPFAREQNQAKLERLNTVLQGVIGLSNGGFEYHYARRGQIDTGLTVPQIGAAPAALPAGAREL